MSDSDAFYETFVGAFIYTDLKNASEDIRLIKILPGNDQDSLQCSLEHGRRKDVKYTCLSYCWGMQGATHSIMMNGFRFIVRSNLFDFLLTARRQGFNELLWIDAISINQDNFTERNSQVTLMGETYKRASRTILWLGLPLSLFDDLLQLQHKLVIAVTRTRNRLLADFKQCYNQLFDDLVNFDNGSHARWNALPEESAWFEDYAAFLTDFSAEHRTLESISNSDYWRRAWIVQEIVLSREACFFTSIPGEYLHLHAWTALAQLSNGMRYIGTELEASGFLGINDTFKGLYDTFLHGRGIVHAVKVPSLLNLRFPLSLETALTATSNAGCTDHRDRVYAIRALLPPEQRMDVDYLLDENTLLHELLCHCVRIGMLAKTVAECAKLLFQALLIPPTSLTPLPSKVILFEEHNYVHENMNLRITSNRRKLYLSDAFYWEDRKARALSDDFEGQSYGVFVPMKVGHSAWIMLEHMIWWKETEHTGNGLSDQCDSISVFDFRSRGIWVAEEKSKWVRYNLVSLDDLRFHPPGLQKTAAGGFMISRN